MVCQSRSGTVLDGCAISGASSYPLQFLGMKAICTVDVSGHWRDAPRLILSSREP